MKRSESSPTSAGEEVPTPLPYELERQGDELLIVHWYQRDDKAMLKREVAVLCNWNGGSQDEIDGKFIIGKLNASPAQIPECGILPRQAVAMIAAIAPPLSDAQKAVIEGIISATLKKAASPPPSAPIEKRLLGRCEKCQQAIVFNGDYWQVVGKHGKEGMLCGNQYHSPQRLPADQQVANIYNAIGDSVLEVPDEELSQEVAPPSARPAEIFCKHKYLKGQCVFCAEAEPAEPALIASSPEAAGMCERVDGELRYKKNYATPANTELAAPKSSSLGEEMTYEDEQKAFRSHGTVIPSCVLTHPHEGRECVTQEEVRVAQEQCKVDAVDTARLIGQNRRDAREEALASVGFKKGDYLGNDRQGHPHHVGETSASAPDAGQPKVCDMRNGDVQCPALFSQGGSALRCEFVVGHTGLHRTYSGTEWECFHPNRSGGNDYIQCIDCGKIWDYRKAAPSAPASAAREQHESTKALAQRMYYAYRSWMGSIQQQPVWIDLTEWQQSAWIAAASVAAEQTRQLREELERTSYKGLTNLQRALDAETARDKLRSLLHYIQLAVCDPAKAVAGETPSEAKAVEIIIDQAQRAQAAEAERDKLRDSLKSASEVMTNSLSLVEFYAKREMESPSNSQEAARETGELLRQYRKVQAELERLRKEAK